jgi:hypothetical protein
MLLTSRVFNNINCTPSATSTLVHGIRLLSASNTNLFAYNDQAFRGPTTTLPLTICETASVRLNHHGDSAIIRLHRYNDFASMSTSFGALTSDMQDYDFKARFESLPDSMNRLDTQGLLTRV